MPALWPAVLRALEVVWARRQGERWLAGAGWICTCRACTPEESLALCSCHTWSANRLPGLL